MDFEHIKKKLTILTDAAKYGVSCSSSGGNRKEVRGDLGNTSAFGIYHSFTKNNRCISLLKILLTSHCIYDCVYCVSRRFNNIKRTAFTIEEIVDLTINFYRGNYVEGLFLSSDVSKDPSTTMERLVRVAKKLQLEERFDEYIHLRTVPGASDKLTREASSYVDRLSINLEIPTKKSLKLLAPEKDHRQMLSNVEFMKNELAISTVEKQKYKHAPKSAPTGQTTRIIIGATNETDRKIIHVADYMYQKPTLERVYCSGYVLVLQDSRLPSLQSQVPIVRENCLYQADWLMRCYDFAPNEIVDEHQPFLNLGIDPKLAWTLRSSHLFPMNINRAPREMLPRTPGVGVRSVQKILMAHKFQTLSYYGLKKVGVTLNQAKCFITCSGATPLAGTINPLRLRGLLLSQGHSEHKQLFTGQLPLF